MKAGMVTSLWYGLAVGLFVAFVLAFALYFGGI